MRVVLQLGLASLIVASTYFAILRIAEDKADALAGAGCYSLASAPSSEKQAFDAFLQQLRAWGEPETVASLIQLREHGHLWVAPHLPGGRSAIWVSSLHLVSRIYVRSDGLVDAKLPFPNLDVPAHAQRTFARIRLAGTLHHELLHYGGLVDELATYDEEIAWYERLREKMLDRLEGEDRRWFQWAADSAIESALAARGMADAPGGDTGVSQSPPSR